MDENQRIRRGLDNGAVTIRGAVRRAAQKTLNINMAHIMMCRNRIDALEELGGAVLWADAPSRVFPDPERLALMVEFWAAAE